MQDPSTLMRSLTGALRREGALVEEGRRLGQELDALQVPPTSLQTSRGAAPAPAPGPPPRGHSRDP